MMDDFEKYSYILIVTLITLNSCIQNQEQEVSINDDFLSSHEWVIDTIYGEEQFIIDWIYFTPEKEFYRFSKYRKSYVVDSALTWAKNKIIKNGEEIFKINVIDSQYIELKGLEKVYRAERGNKFDPTDVEKVIKNNELKLMINGRWYLDSMEIEKTRMPSFCKEITVGATFDFKDEGTLVVYQRDSIESCNKYSYCIYKNKISLTEWDMIMTFPIEKLEMNILVFKSRFVPRDVVWTEETFKAKKNGFKMYFTKTSK